MAPRPVLHRAQLRAAGNADADVRQLLRAGALTAVHRGVYLRGAAPDDPVARHELATVATMSCVSDQAAASHVPAAVLHGLPVWGLPLDRVHVTRHRRSGARVRRGLHVHTAALPPQDVVERQGVRVTGVARTVVDLARTVPFEQAVAVADAALHGSGTARRRPARGGADGERGDAAGAGVEPEALATALARAARWPGSPAARRVLAFADGRSDSVGESRSRVALARAGLPPPVPQWAVTDEGDGVIGYVDFGWPQLHTVGEFDGRVKYGRLLRPGRSAQDVLFAEKLREDRLRDQGLAVVRWTWADLAEFDQVANRLRRRFRR